MLRNILFVVASLVVVEYLHLGEGVYHFRQAHAPVGEDDCEQYRRCCGSNNNGEAPTENVKLQDFKFAVCEVKPNPSKTLNDTVSGVIHFRQRDENSNVQIAIQLKGFDTKDKDTYHGFHIHALGTIEGGCESAGAHYNPFGALHGSPHNDRDHRHVGDLGNIVESADGTVFTHFSDDLVSLSGPHSVMGRAIVIHQNKDDLGRGGDAESTKTGNAGTRLACGIIAAADGQFWGAN